MKYAYGLVRSRGPKIFEIESGSVIQVHSKNFGHGGDDCYLVTEIYAENGELVGFDAKAMETDICRAVVCLKSGQVYWASEEDTCVVIEEV